MDTTAHSGRYVWWSNRGDESDTTLTRTFDLTGLEQATLQAWLWYDIEKDYDYAYVEVSTDGGQTWEVLGSGLPSTFVFDLAVHPRENLVIAATHGRGMWALDADPLNKRDEKEEDEDSFNRPVLRAPHA